MVRRQATLQSHAPAQGHASAANRQAQRESFPRRSGEQLKTFHPVFMARPTTGQKTKNRAGARSRGGRPAVAGNHNMFIAASGGTRHDERPNCQSFQLFRDGFCFWSTVTLRGIGIFSFRLFDFYLGMQRSFRLAGRANMLSFGAKPSRRLF